MGQAKNRGTFEERKAAAEQRAAENKKAIHDARQKHWDSLSDDEKRLAVRAHAARIERRR